jgi:hypothetical protein
LVDFFINNIEDVKIIDQEIRPSTLIMLGKKRHGEGIEKIEDAVKGRRKEEGNASSSNINNEKRQKEKKNINRSSLEELEPELKVMEYIYTREKKTLNRNFILRPPVVSSFESLLQLSKRIFMNKGNEKIQNETMSFLEELVSGGSDLRGNKAIIIVPATFYPGNICQDNAKEFLLNSQ